MTLEFALAIALGVVLAFGDTLVRWWRWRDPRARVNGELTRARARRRR